MRLKPSISVSVWKREDSNWRPLSVLTVEGTPKFATCRVIKTRAPVSAVISERGIASGQRGNLSMQVSIYVCPSDGGRGPTMLMCTWSHKPGIWCWKSASRRFCVSMHFTTLTPQTSSCPIAYISVDSWPDKTCSNQLWCGSDARVRQIMQSMKNGLSKLGWDVWTRISSKDITHSNKVLLGVETGTAISWSELSADTSISSSSS